MKKRILLTLIMVMLHILLNAMPFTQDQKKTALQNSFFSVVFNKKSGLTTIYRHNGDTLLTGLCSSIHTKGITKIPEPSDYSWSVERKKVNIAAGTGWMMAIHGRDPGKKLDMEIKITLLDSLEGVILETIYRNVSDEDVVVYSVEPLPIIREKGGSLFFQDASKCLTNGAMYYDAGTVHTFGELYRKPEPYGETKGGVMKNEVLSASPETVQSWWNVGLFSGYNREGMSLGYIENKVGMGRIIILKTGKNHLSFVAESVFNPGFVLKKGHVIPSDRFMINLADNPYKSLEDYAAVTGKISHGNTRSPVNGWCNWFYTLDDFGEEEIIRNCAYAAKVLKPYGLEYIQIDEGYQTWHGEWRGNTRFPNGMKGLASRIKSYGLKPGIWISPFVVSDTVSIFRQHPDWFLKNEEDSLKRTGPWPDENGEWFRNERPKRYGLDITHPGAEKWFTDLMDTITNNWGFEMLKIDFVAWTVFSAHHFFDPSQTPAQVYKKAFSIIRNMAGESCHLLDCGPGNITAGITNSMRIELDQNYGYRDDAWKQYFSGPSCSAAAAGNRYYFHNKTWVSDADHVCIDLLSLPQSQAAATLIALTGGNTMSGDRLLTLDPSKIEILKKIFPSAGINARPVDLWDADVHTTFAAHCKKDFGEWTIAGFFNPDVKEKSVRKYSLDRLWLDPDKIYLCYDFWKEQFMGEMSKEIRVDIDPGSVTLLSIHEKKDIPQLISTSRHIMQGLVEVKKVSFDRSKSVLSVISTAPPGSSHYAIVYIPGNYQWEPTRTKMYDDYNNYTVKKIADNILRVNLIFENTSGIKWELAFQKTE